MRSLEHFQVRLSLDSGFWISDLGFLSTIDDVELTVEISLFVLWSFLAFQRIFNPHSAIVDPVAHPSPRSRDINS
jgi:hypothetical protein